MKHSKKAAIIGLIYGLLLFISCRLNLSGKLFFPNRPWISDALGSAIAGMIFIIMGYLLLRLNPFNVFEKTAFKKSWKQAFVNVFIVVLLFGSLLIAKSLIIRQNLDIISMVLSGFGVAMGTLIAIALSQRKNHRASMKTDEQS